MIVWDEDQSKRCGRCAQPALDSCRFWKHPVAEPLPCAQMCSMWMCESHRNAWICQFWNARHTRWRYLYVAQWRPPWLPGPDHFLAVAMHACDASCAPFSSCEPISPLKCPCFCGFVTHVHITIPWYSYPIFFFYQQAYNTVIEWRTIHTLIDSTY